MPSDAKLGLTGGLILVVVVAVVFFRKEPLPDLQPGAVAATPSLVSTQPTGYVQRHTVQEGDTLYSLARRYYKDDARFVEIFQANRQHLAKPETLTPGMVLSIPNMPDPPAKE